MNVLVVVLLGLAAVIGAEKLPKGVPPSRAAYYTRAKEFQCLDGSLRISWDQVNDDYCDCADGSDEPGTSACPNGRFYCANKLHKPEMLLSSRVNDGICDCCDGTDEYDGKVKCPNSCEEIGRSARLEHEKKQAMRKVGWEKRKALAAEGLNMKQQKEAGLAELRVQREGIEAEKLTLEAAKKEADDKEIALRDVHSNAYNAAKDEKKKAAAALLFGTIDTDKNNRLSASELVAIPYLDTNGDGKVEDHEITIFLNNNEDADLDHFVQNSFFAVRQKLRDARNAEKQVNDGAQEAAKDEEEETKVEVHGDDEEDEEPLPGAVTVDEFDDEIPFPPFSEEATAAFEVAKQAREKMNEFDTKRSEMDNRIRDAESFGTLDFGTDLAWAPLKGKCFELEDGQYVYKLCPFDRCSQKEKNGYGETSLGTWKGWQEAYSSMSYGDGQTCWNGPARSTVVQVECGDEDVVVEASEPGRCEYRFVYRTPAACEDPAKDVQVHQEL